MMGSECNLRSCSVQKNAKAALLCTHDSTLCATSCLFVDNNTSKETVDEEDDSMDVEDGAPESIYTSKYDRNSLLAERGCLVRAADCVGLKQL
jgi:hypothetical protein